MSRSRLAPHDQLRARMEELGFSQTDLARELDVADSVICRLLSGERGPSLKLAVKIARSKVGIPVESWTLAG